MAECIRGFKDPNENDENNEKNNFDENYKKLLSIASFMTHKHSSWGMSLAVKANKNDQNDESAERFWRKLQKITECNGMVHSMVQIPNQNDENNKK